MQASTPSKRRWLALLAVVSAYTFTFISRYVWSPLMGTVSQEFALNSAQGGIYMSAFFAGYVLTQLPGGLLSDRLNPKIVLIAATVFGGLAAGLMYTVNSFSLGIAFRFLAGMASGFVMSACSKVLTNEFAPQERGVALGILMASPPFGITLANLIGPLLRDSYGWRNTFLFVGFLAILVILVLVLFVKNHTPNTEPAKKKAPFTEGFLDFAKNPNQWLVVIGGFMFLFTTTGFPTWIYRLTESLGFEPTQRTLIAMSYSIAGIAGSVLSGVIATRLKMNSRSFLMATYALMAVFSLLLVFHWQFSLFFALGIIYGFLSYLPASHQTALAIQYAKPEHTATAVACQNLFMQMASVLQPVFLGALIDSTGGFSIIWYAFAITMAIGVVAVRATKSPNSMR